MCVDFRESSNIIWFSPGKKDIWKRKLTNILVDTF